MAKIISFRTACYLSKKLREQGKKVIFTSGCFDILHIGHIDFFNKIRRWGGFNSIIFVGVDSNEYVIANKHRLFFAQNTRAKVLSSLSQLNFIILLQEKALASTSTSKVFIRRLKLLHPHVVAYGNTEPEILSKIKNEAQKSDCLFKHLPHRNKLESTSRIAKILQTHFPSWQLPASFGIYC